MRPGASSRLLAEVRDLAGRAVPSSSVSWASTDSGVARVDSASGWVYAVRPGRALVVAASGEWRDSAPIVVRRPAVEPPVPASVSISPFGSLRVGDTITLTAAVLDGSGAPLTGAEIAWSSSEPELAAIDPLNGRVQANAPGTATIIATSGSKAARSEMTILPADLSADTLAIQGYESEPPPEKPKQTVAEPAVTLPENRDAERQRLDAGILTGVQQCYDALRSKNVARVAELYQPTKKSDVHQLNKLTRILRTDEWGAVVGQRVDGTQQLGTAAAAMEFSFQLVWKDAFGGRLTSHPVFRAEFARNGKEWEISSCRMVGSPKL
jgi:hypothetical protein